jgi:hypothetical protein
MYGITAYNSDGGVILDQTLPYTPLVASGSVVSTGWNLNDFQGQLVNYGVTITNSLLFVRTRNTNAWLAIVLIGSSSFRFKADLNEIVDWRLYAADGSSDWTENNAYGLTVFSSSSDILYSTNKYPPFIRNISTIVIDNSTFTGNDNSFIKTIEFGFTAYDGGIPFISAYTLCPSYATYGGSTQIGYCVATKWNSTTNCSFYWKRAWSVGSVSFTQTDPVGYRPITSLTIK